MIFGAFATSIDAMAVGVTFAFEGVDTIKSSLFIALVCFVCCMLALKIGIGLGDFLGKKPFF